MIKIIDNLLPHNEWKLLHDYYLTNDESIEVDCPYLYLDHMVENDHFQFVHPIATAREGGYFNRLRVHRIKALLEKLKVDYLLRCKVNLTTCTPEPLQSTYHCDSEQNNITAIYYINTCNGKTRFKDEDIDDVDSVANRAVVFPSHLMHCTVTATDVKARVVININYLPWKGPAKIDYA